MKIKAFVFNPFQEHCFVLSNKTECIIIDPGCCNNKERSSLSDYIKEENLNIKYLLNTHLHIDHIMGNRFIQSEFGIGASANENDEFLLENMYQYACSLGLMGNAFTESIFYKQIEAFPLQNLLCEGDIITIDGIQLDVIEIPGHTPGHLAFYNKQDDCIFSGDAIFRGSIGRTDLAGKDENEMYNLLITSIKTKILSLPDTTTIFTGHGPTTTVGQEKRNNPYLS